MTLPTPASHPAKKANAISAITARLKRAHHGHHQAGKVSRCQIPCHQLTDFDLVLRVGTEERSCTVPPHCTGDECTGP
jgi:hypothetical protein